jgi:hypothetical protein
MAGYKPRRPKQMASPTLVTTAIATHEVSIRKAKIPKLSVLAEASVFSIKISFNTTSLHLTY